MKKLIIILFIFSAQTTFSQEKETKKHQFSFDFGIAHSKYWKDILVPANDNILYCDQVTLNPGYIRKPAFYFQTGLIYKKLLSKGFFLDIKLNYTERASKKIFSSDTLQKYYRFPNSLKGTMPYSSFYQPVLKKEVNNYIFCTTSVGYKYKRFDFSIGYLINILTIDKYHYEYEDYPDYDKYFFRWFYIHSPTYKFRFLLIKKKYPISIFLENYHATFIGFESQLR